MGYTYLEANGLVGPEGDANTKVMGAHNLHQAGILCVVKTHAT